MAQIVCCTLDVFYFYTGDETVVVVDWLREMAHTLLVPSFDILEVMYIKAELFWLGRCQDTFI